MKAVVAIACFGLLLLASQASAIHANALSSHVRIQMHLRRINSETEIEEAFQTRSTPGSPTFRQHLTLPELTKLVQAAPEARSITLSWLDSFKASRGVEAVTMLETGDVVVAVVARGSSAAAALGLTDSSEVFSPVARHRMLRRSVAIPSALIKEVTSITAVPQQASKLHRKRHIIRTERAGKLTSEPGMDQTPATIKARYNVPNTTLNHTAVQGVGEFQQSYFNESWISNFTERYHLEKPDIRIHGPNAVSSDNVEGTLDLEYIIGMSPGATTWWISSNDTSFDPYGIDFAWWSNEVMKLTPMPNVVSLSWGIGENNYYGHESIMATDNDGFRKLGLLGVTVFAASGDDGPGSRGFLSCTQFDPSWPASSPYLTSVGATYADAMNSTEVAVHWSGGGFSDYFPRPSWQAAAVAGYLIKANSTLPAAKFFNSTGRGFPDVAALGTNFQVYGPGGFWGNVGWNPVSGTSCASPTFASLITRLNSMRRDAGKSTLGFINPALYAMADGPGYDVISGANTDPDCFGIGIPGFATAVGWDPVTGLGTPDFVRLAAALLKD